MYKCEVLYKESLKRKIDPDLMEKIASNVIRQGTLEAERRCKTECPVKTGELKRGHSSNIRKLEGTVSNNVEYARFVIHGTSKQSPNNYPARVVKSMSTQKYVGRIARQELNKHLKD